MSTWSAAELASFLDQLRGDPLHPPVLLAATTGMRRGEVLGLRWRDTDLDADRVAVRQTLAAVRDVDADPRNPGRHLVVFGEPKTAKGRRTVPLPPQTVAVLRAHRKAQAAERLAVGPDYRDQGLVFAEPDGSPIHPDKVPQALRGPHRPLRVAPDPLPRPAPHLRHPGPAGRRPPQGRRRGPRPRQHLITLDTYSYAIPAMQESAAATVARLVFGS
jgi:integrase